VVVLTVVNEFVQLGASLGAWSPGALAIALRVLFDKQVEGIRGGPALAPVAGPTLRAGRRNFVPALPCFTFLERNSGVTSSSALRKIVRRSELRRGLVSTFVPRALALTRSVSEGRPRLRFGLVCLSLFSLEGCSRTMRS
jgi:hypothetical protein